MSDAKVCYRRGCGKSPADHIHLLNRDFYCGRCAREINRANGQQLIVEYQEEPIPFDIFNIHWGIFWTEGDGEPVAIFRRKEDADDYAERMHVAADGDEMCQHLDNGDIAVLRCTIEGTYWNGDYETDPRLVCTACTMTGKVRTEKGKEPCRLCDGKGLKLR